MLMQDIYLAAALSKVKTLAYKARFINSYQCHNSQ